MSKPSLPVASLEKISPLLNEGILLNIVRLALNDPSASLSCHTVHYATAPGEGYLGIVYRIFVEAKVGEKTTTLSMIAKGMPANLARRKTWKIPSFFKNEVQFYGTILPMMSDFEKRKRDEKALSENPFLPVPNCLASFSDGENDYIIMGDLGEEGFSISERTEGFNQGHCEAALKMLGHFHGLGLAFKFLEPETFQRMVAEMVEPYYRLDYESWYSGFLKNLQTVALDAVTREYPNSEYEKRMREFANENQYKLMCEMVKPREPYSVPLHGDAWGPNFMYKYNGADRTRPADIKLLDFQLMRYASPALDVLFFLYSVSMPHQLEHGGFERQLCLYHDALSEAITELGGDPLQIFPIEALMSEVKYHGKYGLGMGIESVPLSMVTSDEVSDLDAIPGEDEVPLGNYWKVSLIESKEGRLRMAGLIKFSVDQNFI